jgi:hypothetical protein
MMRKTYSRGMTLAARALAAVALALLCGVGSRAVAQDSGTERKQNIRRLLELTKAAELGDQVIGQSIAQIKTNLDQLPPEARGQISPEMTQRIMSVFEEELRKEFTSEKMIEAISPIYEKYLTDEDVKGLIVFYESPLGQKVTNVLPQITREAYAIGAGLGRQAGMRALAKLRDEGALPTPGKPVVEPKAQPQNNTGTRRGRRRH